MQKFTNSKSFGLLFFTVLNVLFFWPYFLQGKIPLDPNPLYQNYPWKTYARPDLIHRVDPTRDFHYIDSTLSIYPLKQEMVRQIQQGKWPLWTDLVFCGAPMMANHHVAPFDFLGIFYFILPFFYGYGLVIIIQFILAGWFQFLLCREMKFSTAASLLAGTAFMWNGLFFHAFANISSNGTLCWMPLICYYLLRLSRSNDSRAHHGLTFAALAQTFGGLAQYWLYNFVIAGAFLSYLFVSLIRKRNGASPWIFLRKTALSVALAVLLALPQLLTFFVALQNSPRAGEDPVGRYQSKNHISPRILATLAIPDLYGRQENNLFSRMLLSPPEEAKGSLWNRMLLGENGSVYHRIWGYFGLITLLLALYTLKDFRRDPIWFWGFLAIAPIAFLVLLNFRFFANAVTALWPAFNTIDHTRSSILFVFPFSVLGGFGLDTLREKRIGLFSKGLTAVVLAGALIGTALYACAWFFPGGISGMAEKYIATHQQEAAFSEHQPSFYSEAAQAAPAIITGSLPILLVPAALAIGLLALVALFQRERVSWNACSAAIVVLAVVDLFYRGWCDPQIFFTPRQDFYPKQIAAFSFLRENQGGFRVLEIQQREPDFEAPLEHYSQLGPYRRRGNTFFIYDAFKFVARPDSLVPYGIHSAGGYMSLYPGRYQKLWNARPQDNLTLVKPGQAVDSPRGPWLDLQSVRFLLAVPGSRSNVYQTAYSGADLTIFRNDRALPRTFVVDQAEVIPDTRLLDRIRSDDFDPHKQVLLEQDPGVTTTPESLQANANITQAESAMVAVDATTNKKSFVVLTDNAFPGWKASVDGHDVRIFRADYTFMAVALEPGKHHIVFSYDPPELQLGLRIAGVAALLWLGLLLYESRAAKARP